ncbi:Uncharacterised protein [Sphingobacterium spiritivorum]|nr:Uncharacterised protein [Sphingobacterium spiritivorum]
MGIAERFFLKISVSEIAGKLFYCEDIAMGGKCALAAKSTGKKKAGSSNPACYHLFFNILIPNSHQHHPLVSGYLHTDNTSIHRFL